MSPKILNWNLKFKLLSTDIYLGGGLVFHGCFPCMVKIFFHSHFWKGGQCIMHSSWCLFGICSLFIVYLLICLSFFIVFFYSLQIFKGDSQFYSWVMDLFFLFSVCVDELLSTCSSNIPWKLYCYIYRYGDLILQSKAVYILRNNYSLLYPIWQNTFLYFISVSNEYLIC